jgi:hypothetical protein
LALANGAHNVAASTSALAKAAKALEVRGVELGLVPLHVDDDVETGADGARGLVDAVGAAVVLDARHHGLDAKRARGLEHVGVVDGEHDPLERAATRQVARGVHAQRQPGLREQHLARQPLRREPRGNDGDGPRTRVLAGGGRSHGPTAAASWAARAQGTASRLQPSASPDLRRWRCRCRGSLP